MYIPPSYKAKLAKQHRIERIKGWAGAIGLVLTLTILAAIAPDEVDLPHNAISHQQQSVQR